MPPASESSTTPPAPQDRAAPTAPEEVAFGPLALRRIRADDAADIASAVAASLEHLRPWMSWATPDATTRQAQAARIVEADELWDAGTDFLYSILTAPGNVVVGEVGLHRRREDGCVEIGYWIGADHVRRGLGTAAARAATQVALAMPGTRRAEIHCDEANAASAAVARGAGYRLERVDEREPQAPGERGRLMIWVAPDGASPRPGARR